MPEPSASVVIATRERPELLQRAVRSILDQTLQDIEVVVVDDGSSPAAVESYRSGIFASDPRVSVHLASAAPYPVRGACAARNYGLSLARAPYFVFFDDDDVMIAPDHLETALAFYKKFPDSLYFGDIRMENAGRVILEGRLREMDAPMLAEPISTDPPIYRATLKQFAAVYAHRWPHPNAVVYQAEKARSIGGLTDGLQPAEDLNFCLRYADRCDCVIYRRQPVALFDVTPRPRLFAAFADLHRHLIGALSVSHGIGAIRNPHLINAARRTHAYFLALAAETLNASGDRLPARHFARLSLSLRLSGNGLRQFARSFTPTPSHPPRS
jgi:glycosyltransferase involved in cell wall biosynthesis